jgi:uncharacterized membrane protein (DUF485 family)
MHVSHSLQSKSIFKYKLVDQRSQFITPAKCIIIFTYKCHRQSSGTFLCHCTILRENMLPNLKPAVTDRQQFVWFHNLLYATLFLLYDRYIKNAAYKKLRNHTSRGSSVTVGLNLAACAPWGWFSGIENCRNFMYNTYVNITVHLVGVTNRVDQDNKRSEQF